MTVSYASLVSHRNTTDVQPEDSMPYSVYLVCIFVYLILVACAAILIDDLTLIFGIIAGVAECTTVFILPSIFYLVACRQEDKKHEEYERLVSLGQLPNKDRLRKKGGKTATRLLVYVYLIFGIVYFIISNYFNFAKMVR